MEQFKPAHPKVEREAGAVDDGLYLGQRQLARRAQVAAPRLLDANLRRAGGEGTGAGSSAAQGPAPARAGSSRGRGQRQGCSGRPRAELG